jgi:hypothetical protein
LDAAAVIERGSVRRASWLVAALAVVTPISAQESSELGLSQRDCASGAESSPSRELMELVRLELRADGVIRVTGTARSRQYGTLLWVERGCSQVERAGTAVDRGEVMIGYRDEPRQRNLQRSLSLSDVPPALRQRALALALAELFRAGEASATEGTARTGATRDATGAGTSSQAGVSAAATDSSRASLNTGAESSDTRADAVANASAESERATHAAIGSSDAVRSPTGEARVPQSVSTDAIGSRPAWALALGPALHALPASAAMLFGAEIALSWRRVSAGVLGNLGSDSDPLGSVDYRRLHGFVTYEALSTEPATFRVTAGIRASLGATFTHVTPVAAALPRNATAASGDLALETGVAWSITRSWQTKLSVDIGYAFGPRIQADDRDLANFSGLFVGASLRAVAAFGR